MLCTMSTRSASNLSRSLFCGGHFLDLKPKLSLFVASLLSCSLRSKKKAFHLIRLMALSTFSITEAFQITVSWRYRYVLS